MNKSDFEIRALVQKVTQKELLDFYSAFRQVTGYDMESPLVTEEYLDENRNKIIVAIRALLSAKLPKEGIDKVILVFKETIDLEK